MPDVSDYSDESEWMHDCVSEMMHEGREQDQAVAACMSMWRERSAPPPVARAREKAAASGVQRRSIPKLGRAYTRLEIKEISEEKRSISGMATTPTVDRIGDIVEPMGAKFAVPLALCLDHHHDQQVGHVEFLKPTKNGIPFKARIVKFDEPGEVKNLVDKAWHLVKTKLRSFVSIGFRPYEDAVEFMDNGGLRYKEWEFLELSLVSIPANMEAVIYEAKSLDLAMEKFKALDTDQLAASGRIEPVNRPGAAGKTRENPVKLKERTAMSTVTVAERISALEAKRAANLARMNTMSEEAGKKGETFDAGESDQYDDLEREIEVIDKQLERERKLEKFNVAKAVPVTPQATKSLDDGAAARGGYVKVRMPAAPPGVRFARVARCVGLARGNLMAAAQIAEAQYGDDQPIVNILKAAVSAGTTMDATWAGALVSEEGAVFADFLDWLRPQTIVGRFGTGNIPGLRTIPFRVPVGSQTSGGSASWVGEAQSKPLTKFDFARTTLEPLKVAAITVVTEELLKYASLPAEVLLRDQLAAALVARIDTDFIDPDKTAVTNVSPASITNGVTAVASTGVTADAVRADVAALLDNFIAVDNPASSAVWIMSASTALRLSMMYNTIGTQEFNGITVNGGTFAGFPVIVSEYVGTSGGSPNTRYVWLVNARDVFFADEGLRIDMSREASLVMDSAPTTMHAGELGSPSAPLAAAMVSMWQTNSVAFRAERTLAWSKARTEAVQGLSGVVWGT